MAVADNIRQSGAERQELARHPMVVGVTVVLLTAFLGAQGGLLAMMYGLTTDVSDLKAGQARLEERISGVTRDIAEIKALLSQPE